jgi:acyl-CoA synthetase (AMP-forming)/AMP-acid ligase II
LAGLGESDGVFVAELIHNFLELSADRCPEKDAIIHGETRATYGEIERRSNQVANWLTTSGVRQADRVALLHRNSVSYVIFYYGVLKTGAVVVPLNTGVDSSEISKMIEDCQVNCILSEKFFSNRIIEVYREAVTPPKSILMSDDYSMIEDLHLENCESNNIVFENFPSDRFTTNLSDQDLSTIVYTSGSTGKPKGVMLSHLNIVSNTKSIVSYLELTYDERCMVVLPFYYVYGNSLLNSHFYVSASLIIDNRFTFPNVVLKTMIDEKVTSFAGVPSTYSILLNRSSISKMEFPDLRYLTQAGGHMPAAVRKGFADLFPDKRFFVMYGATEASARLAFLDPADFPRKTSVFGKPIRNVEMKIVLDDGSEAGVGEEGEILARGPNIMMGYWNAPDETRKVLQDGWYRTGDLGIRDEDGDYAVTGRIRDMIKVGVFKVSAREVEEIIYSCRGVQEASVIGVPDRDFGEAVWAVVVSTQGIEVQEEEIRNRCADLLPAYKVPKEIRFVKALPKSESGKILKRELVAIFSSTSCLSREARVVHEDGNERE